MSYKKILSTIFVLVISTSFILGNDFYNSYKSNFIDKWEAIDDKNKDEKAKLLQAQLKNIRNYNPRKLRRLVALKIVELGSKSDATYRECIDAGIYLAKSGLINGKKKVELLIECEKKCDKLFHSFKFNKKNKKLQAAKDKFIIQQLLVKEHLKLLDYSAAKSWFIKLASTSDSVRDPNILKTLDEDLIRLKGQVESCSKIYKQIAGKTNYTGSLRRSFNNYMFMQYFSPSLSLPFYEESKDAIATKQLKTFLAFQNRGKKVLKSPSYLCAKDTNLPPKLLLLKLSKINKLKDSAQFVQAKINEGHDQFYKPMIIASYELISAEGSRLPTKSLNLKPFYKWALAITKGANHELLFGYLPRMIRHINRPKNGLNDKDRALILKEYEKALVTVKKKLHLYIIQNEPAPKIKRHARVKDWYSKSKQDRREIVKEVYNKLRDLNGGQDSKGLQINDLHLRIDASCSYTSFWPLARIPFTNIDLNRFHGMKALTAFQSMPLERVNVSWSSIENINALKGKENLRYLSISGSSVKNISALQGLKLTTFYMTHQRINDISVLEGMPLQRLDLSYSWVNNFKPIAGMPLTHLVAKNLKNVKSLAPLEHTLLRDLNINGCLSIKSLAPLKKLKINYIYLEDTAIDDLSPLSRMALKKLYFTNATKIRTLSPVRWMQIESLGISHHNLLSQALQYYFPLKRLRMAHTKIKGKDLVYLKNFQLHTLEVYGCPLLKDLRALKLSPTLKTLNVSSCKSLKTLRGLSSTNIENLYMRDLNMKDFTQLIDSKVKKIDARNCGFTSLKGLSKFPIHEMDIRNCKKLVDISEMPESSLKFLKIKGYEKIKDLKPLYKTEGLKHDLR